MMNRTRINFRSKLKIIKGKPDLTPMVDVLFLLLIFFILSSSFVQISGIKVDLPETPHTPALGAEKFVVTIDVNQNFYFNDLPISWDDLKVRMLELGSRHGGGHNFYTIIIRADRDVSFGVVAKLMGVAERVNLNAVVATMQPPRGEYSEIFLD